MHPSYYEACINDDSQATVYSKYTVQYTRVIGNILSSSVLFITGRDSHRMVRWFCNGTPCPPQGGGGDHRPRFTWQVGGGRGPKTSGEICEGYGRASARALYARAWEKAKLTVYIVTW
jgi:hypothetical protein